MVEVHSTIVAPSHTAKVAFQSCVGGKAWDWICLLVPTQMAKTQFQSLQIQARAEQHQSYFCQNYFLGSIILVPLLPRYQTNNHYIEEEGRKSFLMEVPLYLSAFFSSLSLLLSSGYVMNLDNLFPYGHF